MTVKNINPFNPDSLIEGDFSSLPNHIKLPDAGDNHVLYAAIKCQADCIITDKLRLLHNAENAGSFIVPSHFSEQILELWRSNLVNFLSFALFRGGSSNYATISR